MRNTTLPIHHFTGQRAVGIVGGRPVWPIKGGSQPLGGPVPTPPAPAPAPAPATPPATPPPAPPETPPAPGATPGQQQPEEPLGAPGLRALQAERERANTAESALAVANAKIAEFENANLSELEREKARADKAEADVATERTQRLRLEAAAEHGIPKEYHDLLTATDEAALKAQAAKVAALIPANGTPPPPPALPGQGTPPATPPATSVDAGRELWRKKHPKTT